MSDTLDHKWLHFECRQAGESWADSSTGSLKIGFEHGAIATGRTRVFYGYYVKVFANAEVHTGIDRSNLRDALKAIALHCSENGIGLRFVGLNEHFRESGLSFNSGWGYIDQGMINMFEPSIDL